jgi:hypothetical protein
MNRQIVGIALVSISVFGALWSTTTAQQTPPKSQSAADVLRSLNKSSDELQQLLSNLHSPDPSVRVATFNAMVESNNASLVTLAINDAHTSTDATMRDLAVRAAMRQVLTIGFEVPGESDSVPDQFVRFTTSGDLRLTISKYDPEHGMIGFPGGEAEISGTTFSFHHNSCQGTLTAVAGSWNYEGPVTCRFNSDILRARLKITIH